MMSARIFFCIMAAFILLAPIQVMADKNGAFELGIDVGGSFIIDDRQHNAQTVSVPIPDFRLGYFVTSRFELETAMMLEFGKYEYERSTTKLTTKLTIWNLTVAAIYNNYRGEGAVMPFVQAGGGLALKHLSYSLESDYNQDNTDTDTRGVVAFGGGVKIPMEGQLAIKIAADVKFYSQGDNRFQEPWEFHMGGTIGLSFFTR